MAITAKAKSNTAYVIQDNTGQGTMSAVATDLATAIARVNDAVQILKNAGLSD